MFPVQIPCFYLSCEVLLSAAHVEEIFMLQCSERLSTMYSVCVMLPLHSCSQQQGSYCVYGMLAQAVNISITGESLRT